MSSQHRQRTEVKRLYESALEIVDERNLYNIRRLVKKGSKEGFSDYLRQNFQPGVYEKWWIDLQESFSKVGLNFLKFKKKILMLEPDDTESIFPPGYLLFAIDELEAILSSKDYFEEYILTTKAVQSWPEIHYKSGVVDNGTEVHDFNRLGNHDAIAMLNKLWDDREIISPTKTVLKAAKPLTWNKSGAKSIESGKATANTVNKAMRGKGINLRIKFPRNTKGVYLRAQQKSTK